MALLIGFVLVSLCVSFLCSILEAALLSLTPSFIAQQRESRPRLHDALAKLKANPDRPLAAILTLNTVAHTAGATGVGAQVSILYGEAYIGIASAVMTILILVLSEIIPKTIGAKYWRALAPSLPPLLNIMIFVLRPFVWLSEQITSRFAVSGHQVDLRTEITALARLGMQEKALEPDEYRVISSILSLHQIPVHTVMTPRPVCISVSPDTTVDVFERDFAHTPFTRFPVIDSDENPVGYVHRGEIFRAKACQTMQELMHPLRGALDRHSVENAFQAMLRERSHINAVYDEHGGWMGIITLEDIMETILGQDIVDETDQVENMRRFARDRWLSRLKRRKPASEATPPAPNARPGNS